MSILNFLKIKKQELRTILGNREECLAFFAATLARLLFGTIRLRVIDHAGFLTTPLKGPVIMAFWHNRIPAIAVGFLRKYHHHSRKGVIVLTSPSKDGDILSGVMARLGMSSIRGSSSRRGSTALRELSAKLEEGYDLAITPDGPRGPKYSLGPGTVFLAQKTGFPILLLHARYHCAFRLKTWDSFAIPLPFSRIDITTDPYITIDSTLTNLEPERLRIEQLLRCQAI
ncbi:MAG TPA: DUF374 domain-containing protein [Chthoniobacterales bacterium]|nr:DUF374 domain-containing protein [Chthoniobacterales bacterium]